MKSHSGRSVKEGKRWRKGLSPHAIVGRAWSGVAKSLWDGLVSSSVLIGVEKSGEKIRFYGGCSSLR